MDSSITFRVDADVKRKMNEICTELGMTPSTAMNMFVTAFVREQGMPFPVTLKEPVQYLPQEQLLSIADGVLQKRADAYRGLAE